MSILPTLLDSVRHACFAAAIPTRIALRVELVVEELFTNTVRHGYRGDCDHPVWLHALCTPGTLCLTYQDAATAFDPMSRSIALHAQAPSEPGGQGLALIRRLANRIDYQHIEGRNTLTLWFTAATG